LSELNICAKSSLGISIVRDGGLDVSVKRWVPVVVGVLGFVSVFLPAFWSLEFPLGSNDL